MAQDKQSKTEKPTARRLQEARKRGQVAKSAEVNSAAVLMAGLMAMFLFRGYIHGQLSEYMRQTLTHVAQTPIEGAELHRLAGYTLEVMALTVGPVFVAVMVIVFFANWLQIGWLFSLHPLKPDFTKFNPVNGMKRIFSKHGLMELFKSIMKLLIIGGIAYQTIASKMDQVMLLWDQEPTQISLFVLKVSFEIFLKTVWAILILAVIDYIFQKRQFTDNMKMTKHEVKEEFKQMEGDPKVKARIRQIQREFSRRRMMADVPRADVVVTNPTHLAIALLYDAEKASAPMVLAKGQDLVARKIREIAEAHRVTIMEDKPLAQALYKSVEVGQTIPYEFYQAVAEVLAYVYRLKGKAVRGAGRR